uniref:PiggyBac transposable element-derived protein domain-containing protein n=1 Tax=Romanomermis culicivorax TaxID=13658 RepID=A0A915KC03_ROMCU
MNETSLWNDTSAQNGQNEIDAFGNNTNYDQQKQYPSEKIWGCFHAKKESDFHFELKSYFIIIIPKYRCITLSEAIECLQNDIDIEEADIAIIPPNDAGVVTDSEDIDEDILESVEPGEVAGELDVLAPSSDSEQSDSDDETLASLFPVKPPEKKKKITTKWSNHTTFDNPIKSEIVSNLVNTKPELLSASPFELFVEIFGLDYFYHLTEMTNLYAKPKLLIFETTADEIVRFFGILLFSGYHSVPTEKHYWSTSDDLSNNIVTKMPASSFAETDEDAQFEKSLQ